MTIFNIKIGVGVSSKTNLKDRIYVNVKEIKVFSNKKLNRNTFKVHLTKKVER